MHDEHGAFLGAITAERLATALPDAPLGDLLGPRVTAIDADELDGPRAAFDLMVAADIEFAPVLHDGHVVGTLSRKGALRSTLYSPAVDANGRLIVAAAVGINGDVAAKATALAAAGVDVIVIDTAHGHQDGMLAAIEAVAELEPRPADRRGQRRHRRGRARPRRCRRDHRQGRRRTGRDVHHPHDDRGRPPAVLRGARDRGGRTSLGAHVWADGGVRYPRDVALALAAGAASVMIGSWFAGTIEAPGQLAVDEAGRAYKESWGMASTKAVQERFERLDPYELARKTLFAEGISSSKIYLDPQRPSLEDLIDMITSGVRSSFSYAGATSLAEFHDRALVGIQSAAGYEEGKALPVSW